MTDLRDEVAAEFLAAAEKLERAAAHCRIAATHYTDHDVTAGCAHAFAAIGDMTQARDSIERNAVLHSDRARITLDPGST